MACNSYVNSMTQVPITEKETDLERFPQLVNDRIGLGTQDPFCFSLPAPLYKMCPQVSPGYEV